MLVYPGVTQVVYSDLPVTAGCAMVTCLAPWLRPGVTLHYKTRIKTRSNISFLLSLSHNSYVFKEKNKLDSAQTHMLDGDLKIQIKLLEQS